MKSRLRETSLRMAPRPRTSGSRRLATLAIGAAIAISTAFGGGIATAAPTVAPPPAGCGLDSDSGKTDPRFTLWDDVKGETGVKPFKPGNLDVVTPAAKYQPDKKHPKRYAIRLGGDHPGHGDDYLLVPTNRIKGIECSYLWDGSQLNLWYSAWAEAQKWVAKIPAKPLAIGVNSAEARGKDQLHIHLAVANPATVSALKAIKNPQRNLDRWTTTNVNLPVNDPHKTKVSAQFRVVKYTGSLPNLFRVLHKQLPKGEAMYTQSIAVIDAGTPNTYYVLNSTPNLPGVSPAHGTGLADYVYGWGV